MKTMHTSSRSIISGNRQWLACTAAFMATILSLPVNAGITIPDEPMTVGTRIPANILFILDNSGSMTWDYMPDKITGINGYDISTQTYTRNTIYYNPFKIYRPWVNPDGSEMTTGMAYSSVYSDSSRVAPFSTNMVNLYDKVQTFYVPKTPGDSSTFDDAENYFRYEILTTGAVQRSEWGGAPVGTGYPKINLVGGNNKTMLTGFSAFTVPANTERVTITATSATGADLYYQSGANPTTGEFVARSTGSSAKKLLTLVEPDAGLVIYPGLLGRANAGFNGVTLTITYNTKGPGCGVTTGWKNCTFETSVKDRTEVEERANFATWYSYHRTRYKVAKSGAGRAFAQIGTNYRVGYRNIWNNMTEGTGNIPGGGVWPTGKKWNTHPITNAKPIPVTRNEGLFDDPNGTTGVNNNRTAWFQRMYSESYSGNTPLRMALWNAGNYYETDHTATGPWGPGEPGVPDQPGKPGKPGEQFTCRLSYTILTTDGYRNDSNDANFDYTGVGEMVGEQDGSFPLPYNGSNQADTLADIAMKYWKTDLRPDMANNVPASIDDPATHQHMSTFTVSLGAAGSLNPETDLPAITAGTKSWPISKNNDASSVDDLWHAAVNGHGKYVLATDPDKFTKALQDALAEIEKRNASYSNVASSSVSLDTATMVFNASYEQGSWAGGLVARSAQDLTDIKWTASVGAWKSRNIFTSEAGAGKVFPTANQRAALTRTGGTFNYPVTGDKNADYIMGDTSLEGVDAPALRKRSSLLGDIINSSPAYVKDTDTLYVGGNDGMLHAFNATNGQELFGYIPGIINWGLLSTLSRGDYPHKYFVDGPVSVSERSLTASKNILVGSLGRGGKGLFALDVTDPTTASKDSFKWERADTSGNNMGLVLGKPLLVKVRNGSGVPAVVLGNGPNSQNDKAVLIVLDIETGSIIREIDTGVGDASTPNGLFAPTGVYGADGKTISYVYAGDLQGNVWKFDMTSALPADWKAKKLFTATDAGGKAQPITSGVAVAIHPITGKRWVFFGTGRYLTADDADAKNTGVQSMYGFMEDDSATLSRTDLTQRTITVTGSNGPYDVRGFEAKAELPTLSEGWYVDLPGAGERIVQNAQVVSTFLLTASMMPSGDACSASGSGFINAIDAFTGTSAGSSYFNLDNDSATKEEIGGVPVGSVNAGGGMPTLPNLLRGLLVVGGSAGSGVNQISTLNPHWDRVSWREIRND